MQRLEIEPARVDTLPGAIKMAGLIDMAELAVARLPQIGASQIGQTQSVSRFSSSRHPEQQIQILDRLARLSADRMFGHGGVYGYRLSTV